MLVRDGLLVYEPNPSHRRAKLAKLTGDGRGVLRRIQRAQRRWADRHGAAAGEANLHEALELLGRIRGALGPG